MPVEASMQAPTYPPAREYEPPEILPYGLSVHNCPVAELMAIPEAWKVVLKHLPMLSAMTSNPMAQPMLGNMRIPDFAVFSSLLNTPAMEAINADLSELFPEQRQG